MLAAGVRRGILPRRVRVFGAAELLGGASLAVPGGTTVRTPTAPAALDFAGYNHLSLVGTVAGLAVGQTLSVYLNTLDPESAAGDEVPSSLARVLLATVAADGDFAASLYLPSVLSSQFARPAIDIGVGTWSGRNPGVVLFPNTHTCIDEVLPNDSDYIVHATDIVNQYHVRLRGPNLAPISFPGLTGYTLRMRCMCTIPNLYQINQLYLRDGPTFYYTGIGVINTVPANFTTYTIPVTLSTPVLDPNIFDLFFDSAGPVIGGGEFRVSWAEFQAPAGVGGVGTGILPFHYNTLDFVASAGNDPTISAAVAELSRA